MTTLSSTVCYPPKQSQGVQRSKHYPLSTQEIHYSGSVNLTDFQDPQPFCTRLSIFRAIPLPSSLSEKMKNRQSDDDHKVKDLKNKTNIKG